MDRPEQLASLEGQQYLVLRPVVGVASLYRDVQDAALARFGAELPHPHTEHVTLRAFAEPHRRDEVTALIRAWAADRPPLEVSAVAIDEFAAPWQVLLVRLARTSTLVSAYASLTTALASTDLRRLDELPVDDWTFHLSVVYGRSVPPDVWHDFAAASVGELSFHPTEFLTEAEFVWYEQGVEHAETIAFGG